MSPTKRLNLANAIRLANNKKMITILDFAKNKIVTQGDGCNDDFGPAYYNKQGKKCVIGHLLPVGEFRNVFGAIDTEQLKPVVAKLIKKYSINTANGENYARFVGFLRELQLAHDHTFDKFNQDHPLKEQRMSKFISACEVIKFDLERK